MRNLPALFALLLFFPHAFADPGHGIEGEHTHAIIIPDSGGTPPPVEPPPVDPPPVDPPPPDDHFTRACMDSEVTACNAFDTVESVIVADINKTSIGNTPGTPETNNKCAWNGGDRFCAGWHVAGDCSSRPEERSNIDHEASTGYSPCFDPDRGALRAEYWADRRSSNSFAQPLSADAGASVHTDFYALQFEIMFSEALFRTPSGSDTAKLSRLYAEKTEYCGTSDFMSHRWGFSPTEIWLAFYVACDSGDVVPKSPANRPKVPRADAGKWVRITLEQDFKERRSYISAIRVSDGHKYGSWAEPMTDRAPPYVLLTSLSLPMIHSTSHEPEPGCHGELDRVETCGPNPQFWVRHVIASTAPIEE